MACSSWFGMQILALVALVLLSVTDASDVVTASEWSNMINVAGRQRMLSQRMSKEFLFVAKNEQVATYKAALQGSINLFDVTLSNLINGNNNTTPRVPEPVTPGILTGLNIVLGLWTPFKALLEDNVNTVRTSEGFVDTDILFQVASQNVPVLKTSNAVVGKLVDAAKASGAQVAGLVVDIAGRQRMLIQRMAKESLLIAHGISVSGNVVNLKATASLFADSHNGIIEGATWAGVAPLTKMCTLQQMREVSDGWAKFQPFVNQILGRETAAESQQVASDLVGNLTVPVNTLFGAMVKAVSLYVFDDGSTCDPLGSITEPEWVFLLDEVGKQRMLGQKVSRFFMQIANGAQAQQSKVDLTVALDTTSVVFRSLIEGDKARDIQAPPTQELADQLLSGWNTWSELRAELADALYTDSRDAVTVEKVSRLSREVLEELNTATNMYESAAQIAKPDVPSALINVAGRQRMLMQKMAKEAGLINYGERVELNAELMTETRETFVDVHHKLLVGDPDAVTCDANGTCPAGVPRLENICIVEQMRYVLMKYRELEASVLAVAENGSEQNWDDMIALSDPAFAVMHKAVQMFKDAEGTNCTLRQTSRDEYAAAINGITLLAAQSEQVSKDYFINFAGGAVDLDASIAAFESTLYDVKFGTGPGGIPTAMTPGMFGRLIDISDGWTGFLKNMRIAETTTYVREEVEANSTNQLNAILDVAARYIRQINDEQFEADNAEIALELEPQEAVPLARLNAVGRLSMLIQKMCKEAVLVGLGGSSRKQFEATRKMYEDTLGALRSGGQIPFEGRRLQEEAPDASILPYTIPQRVDLIDAMTEMEQDYMVLKEKLTSIVGGSSSPADLNEMNQMSQSLVAKTSASAELFEEADPYVPPEEKKEANDVITILMVTIPLLIVCVPTMYGAFKAVSAAGGKARKDQV